MLRSMARCWLPEPSIGFGCKSGTAQGSTEGERPNKHEVDTVLATSLPSNKIDTRWITTQPLAYLINIDEASIPSNEDARCTVPHTTSTHARHSDRRREDFGDQNKRRLGRGVETLSWQMHEEEQERLKIRSKMYRPVHAAALDRKSRRSTCDRVHLFQNAASHQSMRSDLSAL